MNAPPSDPHQLLGVPVDASPNEVRQAYLKRVREFPPDRAPEEFRAIHDAYKLLSDPLEKAKAMLQQPGPENAPDLNQVIDLAERQRPRLPKLVLLALGNAE